MMETIDRCITEDGHVWAILTWKPYTLPNDKPARKVISKEIICGHDKISKLLSLPTYTTKQQQQYSGRVKKLTANEMTALDKEIDYRLDFCSKNGGDFPRKPENYK